MNKKDIIHFYRGPFGCYELKGPNVRKFCGVSRNMKKPKQTDYMIEIGAGVAHDLWKQGAQPADIAMAVYDFMDCARRANKK